MSDGHNHRFIIILSDVGRTRSDGGSLGAGQERTAARTRLFFGGNNWAFDLHARRIGYKISRCDKHDATQRGCHRCPKDETKKVSIVIVGHFFTPRFTAVPAPTNPSVLLKNDLLLIRFLDGSVAPRPNFAARRVMEPNGLICVLHTPCRATHTAVMTPQAFVVLRNGHIGYVRPIRSENVARFFPELTLVPAWSYSRCTPPMARR